MKVANNPLNKKSMKEQDQIVESREVRYVFSEHEAASLGKNLASANGKIDELEEQKKASASQYSASISAEKEQLKILNRKTGNGYEFRYVDCVVSYHTPDKGMKTLVRLDLAEGEELRGMDKKWTERMEDLDYDRWNDKYRDLECDVEFHIPEVDRKTFTQRSTGHIFTEKMSSKDIENYELACEEKLNFPVDGEKTFTNTTSGFSYVRKMTAADIDRLQTSIFSDEAGENDGEFDNVDPEVEYRIPTNTREIMQEASELIEANVDEEEC